MRPAGGIGALGDGRLLLAARQLRGDQRRLRRSVRRPAEHPRRGIRPRSAVHRTPVRPRRRHAADPRRPRIPDPGEGGRSRAARRPRHAGSDPFGHRDLAHERRGAGGPTSPKPGRNSGRRSRISVVSNGCCATNRFRDSSTSRPKPPTKPRRPATGRSWRRRRQPGRSTPKPADGR